MKTISQRLEECGGFGPGFDFIRIALAFGVMAWHCVAIVEGSTASARDSMAWPFAFSILPMFFALSGFLVTGSALRLPLREYVLNRTFRIVPALAVDIVFCALFLGPLITSVGLSIYFSDPEFFRYFLNIIGWIHYELPGVFENNSYPSVVNGALWTVPYEILCYIIMSALIALGLVRNWKLVIGLVLIITTTASALYLADVQPAQPLAGKFLNFLFFSKGASLIPCFLAGSAVYLMRDFLPFDGRIAGVVAMGLVALSLFAPPAWFDNPIFIAASVLPLTYLVVWLGLVRLPKLPLFDRGDYSYGVYLYHFPILQLMQMKLDFQSWPVLLAAGLAPVTLFAMFSWHSIEKPVLLQRKRFSRVGARIAAAESRAAEGRKSVATG